MHVQAISASVENKRNAVMVAFLGHYSLIGLGTNLTDHARREGTLFSILFYFFKEVNKLKKIMYTQHKDNDPSVSFAPLQNVYRVDSGLHV